MSLSISHGLRKPTNFNSLPAELKNQIFNSLLAPRVVKIFWSYFTKTFYTNARFPSALHLCHDSRSLALAHYTLSFGLTPEKSRIYFSYTHDTADFQWTYLANYSGLGVHYEVLRTKLGAQDYAGLSRITMKERELTGRATDSFVDLRGFRNLSDVFVICDRSAAQVDKNWSVVILQDLWRGLEDDVERWGRGPGRWPRLWCDVCTDEREDGVAECSRHWFFETWNKYAEIGQHRKWATLLSECLHVTRTDEQSRGRAEPAKQLFQRMIRRHWDI